MLAGKILEMEEGQASVFRLFLVFLPFLFDQSYEIYLHALVMQDE